MFSIKTIVAATLPFLALMTGCVRGPSVESVRQPTPSFPAATAFKKAVNARKVAAAAASDADPTVADYPQTSADFDPQAWADPYSQTSADPDMDADGTDDSGPDDDGQDFYPDSTSAFAAITPGGHHYEHPARNRIAARYPQMHHTPHARNSRTAHPHTSTHSRVASASHHTAATPKPAVAHRATSAHATIHNGSGHAAAAHHTATHAASQSGAGHGGHTTVASRARNAPTHTSVARPQHRK